MKDIGSAAAATTPAAAGEQGKASQLTMAAPPESGGVSGTPV
ncbi:MAG: hypothetical protein U5O39_01775 [Gammaproteobacteria bacterium]|nr:hypothetical protein [Gammaproteobacteria bacterium]